MLIDLEKESIDVILESVKNEIWATAEFSIKYVCSPDENPLHTGGSSNFRLYDLSAKWLYHDFFEITMYLQPKYDIFFLSAIKNPENRFNNIKLEVFSDGTYKSQYYWYVDEEEIKADRALGMKFFPEGLSESIRTIMYDSKQFGIKNPTWVSGEQQIRVRDGQVSISTHTVNEQGKKKNFKVEIPEELAKGILDFHEATTEGDFKDQYPKWNLIRIQMDVRYYSKAEKDVTFEWEA
jgi:hypothetical protein